MTTTRPDPSFWSERRVAITGGGGFLGSVVARRAAELGAEVKVIRSGEFDLLDPEAARRALDGAQLVINLAANVGGIGYNRKNPAPLLRDNVLMAINVFDAAIAAGTEKLVTAGSVCAYPKFTDVPFREDDIWNGYPEETNAPYGIAKRVAQELTDTYHRQYGLDAVMPILANLYGPGDDFDLEDSHVIPALVRKFSDAADAGADSVQLWGTGTASREFLYVEDAARALLLAAEHLESTEPVNVGTGTETTIRDLAEMIRNLTGFSGAIEWEPSQPDGQPKRSLEVSRARDLFGFESEIGLADGLAETVAYWRNRPTA
ncbi:MAG TPA: NAD-dependent epimerase/dehydratase family protein [Solirubrobacterales bacterium]|nr:NAD-dependent epimerase/dehydratase family protein [Solirubrobacterales bacterium]